MKTIIILSFCALLMGCSYGIEDYINDPRTILSDPLTVDHRQAVNDLERSYLRKEMTYAEYLHEKKEIEEDYARDVQKREQYD